MTQTERDTIISLMAKIKAEFYADGEFVESMHFTCPLRDNEREAMVNYFFPDHFAPESYRTSGLMSHWQGGWYMTSDVGGEWRKYRGRRVYEIDAGNIFAHDADPVQCVRKWIENYNTLTYNRPSAPRDMYGHDQTIEDSWGNKRGGE